MDGPKYSLAYEEGKTLTLSLNQGQSTIKVKIVRFIQPSTLSCVMEVEILAASGPAGYPEHSILKLYDWRYAAALREFHKLVHGLNPMRMPTENLLKTVTPPNSSRPKTVRQMTSRGISPRMRPTSLTILVIYTNAR